MQASSSSCGMPHRQRGMTLVELMVGLALGLLVSAALLMVFANASTTGQNLNRASVQIETGRYVSELLTEDLRLAGFYGEVPATGAVYTTPDPCATDANPAVTPNWIATPFTLPTPAQGFGVDDELTCLTNRKSQTDALALRRVSTETTAVAAVPLDNAQHYVQYSFCDADPTATKMVFGTSKAAFTLRNRGCTAANPLRAYVSRIYFVASCNRCTGDGDGIPTLKRADLVEGGITETALAEGVEALRFEYGFDTNGDGSADEYLTAEAATAAARAWGDAMSVKAHFVTRSLVKASGSGLANAQRFQLGGTGSLDFAADGYTRRVYTTVIRLVNPSSARELQ